MKMASGLATAAFCTLPSCFLQFGHQVAKFSTYTSLPWKSVNAKALPAMSLIESFPQYRFDWLPCLRTERLVSRLFLSL